MLLTAKAESLEGVCVFVCVFSLLSGRISSLKDETGAVSCDPGPWLWS